MVEWVKRYNIFGRHPEDVIPSTMVGGIDLAQKFDHSAFALIKVSMLPDGPFYELFHLDRLPLGVPYHEQADVFARKLARFGERLTSPGAINLDVSGVGRPVGEMLAERVDGNRWALNFVTIVAGWKVTPPGPLPTARWPFVSPTAPPPPPDPYRVALGLPPADPETTYPTPHERVVGKSHLAISLQKVFQQRRFKADDRHRRYLGPLVEELEAFRGEVVGDGEIRAGASTGKHDDLVVAVGLGCLDPPQLPERGSRISPTGRFVVGGDAAAMAAESQRS